MLKPNSPVTANLIKARELIADERNWCRGHFTDGNRHCAVGSVLCVADISKSSDFSDAIALLHRVAKNEGFASAADLNDEAGHVAVMKMFDKAIELSLVKS